MDDRRFSLALKSLMRNCVFTQHVPALVQRGLGNGGGGKGQECHWMFMHIDVNMDQLILWQQKVVRDEAVIQIFSEASTFETLRYVEII